ncbi:S-layer homology domain-containing protein [Paenibacillus pinistramenti]|uniref:S-layer homology domain-containing protein n=1 Tax=Paenibacillus pinistramenti TaxID=1768003 RepID=UPI0011086FA6|nr:S-layer homology domain-containing protein [Paenibacillus pinistramenti]
MGRRKKLRGAVAGVLSLSMALASMDAVSAQTASDVQGHWAEQQIQNWISSGNLKGYQDGTVKPNNAITRAEFITMINRMFGFTDTGSANFKDLSTTNWAYSDIAKAVKAGYVTGYSDQTFHPGSNISRQEAATIISNILGLDTSNTDSIKQFSDAGKIPAWSQDSISAVVENNIMKGYPNGTFGAQNQLTRAEAVVLIDSAVSSRTSAAEPVTIDQAGTYGNDQETTVVNGDVIINVPGVTLNNYEIKGNLLLGAGIGSGDVTIKNVKVHGTTNVEGGGENSIHFVDSVLVNVVVNKQNGAVRLVAEGTTQADKVIIQSSAKLEESDVNGEGFTDVELAKELPANTTVQLKGKFDDINFFSVSVTVQLQRGSIQDVTVDAAASDNTIVLSSSTQISNLVLNAISHILGASQLTNVIVNEGAQKSTFDTRPSQVQGVQQTNIIVNSSSTVTSTVSSGSSSGGSSSSGSSGSGSTGNESQVPSTPLVVNVPVVDGENATAEAKLAAVEAYVQAPLEGSPITATVVPGDEAGEYIVTYHSGGQQTVTTLTVTFLVKVAPVEVNVPVINGENATDEAKLAAVEAYVQAPLEGTPITATVVAGSTAGEYTATYSSGGTTTEKTFAVTFLVKVAPVEVNVPVINGENATDEAKLAAVEAYVQAPLEGTPITATVVAGSTAGEYTATYSSGGTTTEKTFAVTFIEEEVAAG